MVWVVSIGTDVSGELEMGASLDVGILLGIWVKSWVLIGCDDSGILGVAVAVGSSIIGGDIKDEEVEGIGVEFDGLAAKGKNMFIKYEILENRNENFAIYNLCIVGCNQWKYMEKISM